MIPTILRPVIGRVVAAWVPFITVWVADKLGMAITESMVETLLELAFALTIYGLGHKALNQWWNPADAAAPVVAEAGMEEKQELKHQTFGMGVKNGRH